MKPNFALNLSHEGIVLLHRSPRGAWTEVGEVALTDPALRESMSFLRSTAVALEGKGFGTKLIIPDSQILQVEITATGVDAAAREVEIRAALEGATPYAVDDLVFDWNGDGPVYLVSVVAKETLDEAEEFAVEHRFNPISFVGQASEATGNAETFFGRSDYSFALLGAEVDVRETPRMAGGGVAPESLFVEPSLEASEDPSTPSEITDEESFFEAEAIAADANLFVAEDKQVRQQPEDTVETNATVPAFSSRRTDHSDIDPDLNEDRPIDRVEPRIELTPELEKTDSQSPPLVATTDQESSAPAISLDTIAPENLRANILGPEDSERPKSKIGLVLANSLARARPIAGKVSTIANDAIGKLNATNAFGKLNATSRNAFSVVKSRLKRSAVVSEAQSIPVDTAEQPVDPVEVTPQPQTENKRRKAIIATAAALSFVLMLGLIYAVLPGQEGSSEARLGDGQTDIENASFTTSAERGVRQDNRARARPSDFAAVVASLHPDLDFTSDPGALRTPLRPERRSVFEDSSDPDANLPDTATPVTELTEQELADIRAAGLDAPTLEEIDEGGEAEAKPRLTDEEVSASYIATGALQQLAPPPTPHNNLHRGDIFVASIDRSLKANDAIILPDFNGGVQDDQPRARLSPLSPDTVFDLDAQGLVKPTAEGALNPQGILVRLGKPAVTPPKKPETEQLVPPNPLLAQTPKARPADLKTGEEAIFVQGRLTMAQLRTRKGKARPESIQAEQSGDDATPTELAVLTSFQPQKRPGDFNKTVEKARVKIAAATPATAKIVNDGPVLPTRASVAKQATIKNAINLSKINLIGVYGTPSKRNALLRLPSGRFVKVKIGDRIDGGKVAAIGTNNLSYVKSGRNRVLKIPE